MIKKINIISFIFLLITSLLSLFTYHDDMDVQVPYIGVIFIVLSVILGLLLFLKVNLRWQALRLSFKNEGYQVSKHGFRNAIVYELINIVFYFLVGGSLLLYVGEIWFVGIIIFLHFLEGALHLVINAVYKPYKIIVNDNTIMVLANVIKIVKWNSIKKIEGRHNDIVLIDKLNHVHIIDLDLLILEDAKDLTKKVKQIALDRNLYFGIPEK